MKMQVVDTPKKDVWGVCAINQDRSKFVMRGLGLKEGTCSIRNCKTPNLTKADYD